MQIISEQHLTDCVGGYGRLALRTLGSMTSLWGGFSHNDHSVSPYHNWYIGAGFLLTGFGIGGRYIMTNIFTNIGAYEVGYSAQKFIMP